MKAEIRRQAMLGAVAFIMAFAIYRAWPDGTSASPAPAPTGRGRAASSSTGMPGGVTAPEVHLRALADQRPKPTTGERNLFRYRVRPPAVTAAQTRAALAALAAAVPPPSGPPPPPPLAPIGYKFIGIVETSPAATIAVLSDGKNVFHGREGDIIEGRYRILRIGAESIEMAYLDGRGRQTIRLTGS